MSELKGKKIFRSNTKIKMKVLFFSNKYQEIVKISEKNRMSTDFDT